MTQVRRFFGGGSSGRSASRWFPRIPVLLILTGAVIALTAGHALAANLQPGWPLITSADLEGSAAVGDLDGDGDLEVVFATFDGKVYAWHHDRTPVFGWPTTMGGGYHDYADPAVGDMDGDGDLEVVAAAIVPGTFLPYVPPTYHVYAWHHDGTVLAGWPRDLDPGEYGCSGLALGDLERNGELEIAYAVTYEGLFAWRYDGTLLPGWPVSLGDSPVVGFPAMGDLDSDGDLEVIFPLVMSVYVFHQDGTGVAGWPVTLPEGGTYYFAQGRPALGDLDGDGEPEVVVGSLEGKVCAWHHDGTTAAGWPQVAGGMIRNAPALGDLDGDGELEVVVGPNDGEVHVWHGDGTAAAGWPNAAADSVTGSPALADLDGDGDLEVVVGSGNANVYVWHHDGTTATGWPDNASGSITGSPVVVDLDGDGDLEVVVGSSDGKVFAWTFREPTDDPLPWPMQGHDGQRTASYRRPLRAAFAATPSSGSPPLAVEFTDQSTGGPDAWLWDFGDGGVSAEQHPQRVYEALGRYTVSLAVSTWCDFDSAVKDRYILVTFPDVPSDHWACDEVLSCAEAGIVAGYDDGFYRPDDEVTRDQMAVYIARALAGGDGNVPAFSGTPTFPDVGADFWALDYVEYAVESDVVAGYDDGLYHPEYEVTRDQMAVYVARAWGWVGIDDDMTTGPEQFPDVPAGFWSGTAIGACVTHEVVNGYDDGLYHPDWVVTRDQMAVYVARAFGLM